ncbi:HEPN domain-containing protein [Virgibacillus sp. 6R]|uniref:HEPN domain-containing protein n=1 Tax=Metabacillus sp. 22489 TaxID=3453928 RepID=UPI0011A7BDE4
MSNKDGLQFGNWYVGGTELNLNGILKVNCDTNEFELELYSDELLSIPYNTDVVYGKTYHGNAYTLYGCSIQGSKSTSFIHDYKSKYIYHVNCSYFLEGEIFTTEEEIKVKEVYFSVTNLNKWSFQEALDIKLNESSEYVITTKKVEDITHKNNEFELIISYITLPDHNYEFSGSLKINTDTQLTLKFVNPTSLKRVHNLINQVRDFIALCTNTGTYIKYISAKPYYTESKDYEPIIQIYGKAIEFEHIGRVEKLKSYDYYINLDQIKNGFNLCMKNWFDKNEKLKPVIELYLSLNYHRTSLERYFLNLVQALEAYHRLTRKNQVLPKGEYSKKLDSIIANVPEEHQKWVKGKLAFSNEPSLHERLEELLSPKSKNGSLHNEGKYHYLFSLRDKEKLEIIRDIKNTRNYNTHFDEALLKKSVKGEELYQLIALLRMMMEFYLLMELEIDEDTVVDLTWEKSKQLSIRNSIIESTRDSNIKL